MCSFLVHVFILARGLCVFDQHLLLYILVISKDGLALYNILCIFSHVTRSAYIQFSPYPRIKIKYGKMSHSEFHCEAELLKLMLWKTRLSNLVSKAPLCSTLAHNYIAIFYKNLLEQTRSRDLLEDTWCTSQQAVRTKYKATSCNVVAELCAGHAVASTSVVLQQSEMS